MAYKIAILATEFVFAQVQDDEVLTQSEFRWYFSCGSVFDGPAIEIFQQDEIVTVLAQGVGGIPPWLQGKYIYGWPHRRACYSGEGASSEQ